VLYSDSWLLNPDFLWRPGTQSFAEHTGYQGRQPLTSLVSFGIANFSFGSPPSDAPRLSQGRLIFTHKSVATLGCCWVWVAVLLAIEVSPFK